MLTPGQILQRRYTVRNHLGGGGMGSVYRAFDNRLSLDVAVKALTPQPGLNPDEARQLYEQFRREATVLARLNHPGVVTVTDFFEEDGLAFLVMNLVEGENLAQYVARYGALAPADAARLGGQLLEALEYCHQRQIIHRDVKPNNIILLPDSTPVGRPVLVDFGLVKLWNPDNPTTHTMMRGVGTPGYAPPEQYGFAAGHTDASSDIYSVGATLYYALTAQAPPVATDRLLKPELMVPLPHVAPGLPPVLCDVVTQALELPPAARFATAGAMRAALLSAPQVIAPLPATAGKVVVPIPAPAPTRSRLLLPALLAGVALLAAVGFLAWSLLRGGGPDPQPTPGASSQGVVARLTPQDTTTTAAAPTATAATDVTAITQPTKTLPAATAVPPTDAPPTAVPPTAAPTTAPVILAGGPVAAARIAAPRIDGDLSEWAGQPTYDSPFLVYWDDGWDNTNDGAVRWHLGYDDANLYIAARITDNFHVQTQTGNKVFLGDSLEIQIDTDGGASTSVSPREFQVNLSPGDFVSLPPSANLSQGTDGGGMFDAPSGHRIAVAAQRTADGYTVEAAVPWSDLFTGPFGQPMAIALNMDDNDRAGQAVQEAMYSNAPNRLFFDPSTWLPFSLTP